MRRSRIVQTDSTSSASTSNPATRLLFDYRIVHRSRGNGGAHRRVAVSWRWLGDDARWDPVPGADPVVGSADTWLEPGALITDDDAFPIVHRSPVEIPS